MISEREKMLSGEWYNATVPELADKRILAKQLCHSYNYELTPNQAEKKQEILAKLLGKNGKQCEIIAPFWCDYGSNIELGENFFANHNLVILDCAPVKIGKNVFIGPNCALYTAIHPIDVEARNQGLECAKPITLGDNVWLGGGVQVLPNVTIGANSIIGAGSVVTKNIPSNVIAAGNPCRVLREIGEETGQ